jgi:hypothetical protein
MGKLRLQAINIVVVGILFYPICYYLSILFGVNGILVGMIIVNMSGAVLNTIQLNKVVNHSANGIWSR